MSEVKVNKISPRTNCGTVQLGDSGDTITIPAGATISNSGTASGFGSTGEVSWNTTKITADPGNAVSGVGYFTDTSGGAFNVTLPSSPSAGNVVAVADYANTWDTNNLTIARNGSNIEGAASDFVCNTEGSTITFVYVDATKGWVCTNSGNSNQAFGRVFLTATGGTETECGDYKIHTFTGPGTFTVCTVSEVAAENTVDYLVVAGGGAAPSTAGGDGISGGGGGGGFRYFATTPTNPQSGNPAAPLNGYGSPSPSGTAITVTAQAYPITVGAGMSIPSTGPGTGTPSVFSTVTSAGGGAGGRGDPAAGGYNGGSGGGSDNGGHDGGQGNTPSTTPPQGNNGGSSRPANGGGGGGATAVGEQGPPNVGGNGGAGAGVTGFGTSGESSGGKYYFSGGGGGGNGNANFPQPAGSGGLGGGADGKNPGCTSASNGTANTGGGGGGASDKNPVGGGGGAGGAGGSGIVVIRYKFQ